MTHMILGLVSFCCLFQCVTLLVTFVVLLPVLLLCIIILPTLFSDLFLVAFVGPRLIGRIFGFGRICRRFFGSCSLCCPLGIPGDLCDSILLPVFVVLLGPLLRALCLLRRPDCVVCFKAFLLPHGRLGGVVEGGNCSFFWRGGLCGFGEGQAGACLRLTLVSFDLP